MSIEGYRKFGLAGVIAGAAVLDKQWTVALVALGVYSVSNLVEHIWGTK